MQDRVDAYIARIALHRCDVTGNPMVIHALPCRAIDALTKRSQRKGKERNTVA